MNIPFAFNTLCYGALPFNSNEKYNKVFKNSGLRIAPVALWSAFAVFFLVLSCDVTFAHPGRTDANGGHFNRDTGEYHTHVKKTPEITLSPLTEAEPFALKFAAWNIRIFSNRSRTDAELHAIAKTLADYDFIAIVEVRDAIVLQRTQNILAQMGKRYQYEVSPAVGHRSKERYAFLYREDLVTVVKEGELYLDAADGTDDFSRDPYWATFRADAFDFSVIAVHVIWGDRVGPRKAEVQALAEVYRYVQQANGPEEDVLLVGDFNRNPNDTEAYGPIMAIPSMVRLFDLPQKSHIRDTSLYDNIFFQSEAVTEYLDISGIDRFDETDFGNDDKVATLAVSDHRPVWALFDTRTDDDDISETSGNAHDVNGDGVINALFDTRTDDDDISETSGNAHDVNGDGVINILDLVTVANGFGDTEPDINGDGVVNILDLIGIAQAMGAP